MYKNHKIVVVMPGYNAAKTLEKTYNEIDFNIVDEVVFVDDHSTDDCYEVAQRIGIDHIIRHNVNKGYGGNQKTCYNKALEIGADIAVMLHPDYQYSPKLIPAMVSMIVDGEYPAVIASRFLGKGALKGGMPIYKYVFNRLLTWTQNFIINERLSEYHTGYRAFHRDILKSTNLQENSDNFIFDNEMLSQILYNGYLIGEITCPTKYFDDASSINLKNSSVYGAGVLRVSLQHFLQKIKFTRLKRYETI